MSGYDSASRDAYQRVDISAGQARILSAFRPGLAITRQELVTLTGLPINSVSGRCTELLEAKVLESLPPVEGRHPLRLKNAAGRANQHKIDTGSFGCINTTPAAPIGVIPTLFSRQSMTPDEANRSTGREAELVRRYGQFRIWDDGQNQNECARVAEILKA